MSINNKLRKFTRKLYRKICSKIPKLSTQDLYPELKGFPRYTETDVLLFGRSLKIPDGASFLFMFTEIFNQEIYKFKTSNQIPYIIDAGANIGLASIYFQRLFPDAKIVAFEPDPKIFTYLKYNIDLFGFKNISLLQKGLWHEETKLEFNTEGADAGAINFHKDGSPNQNSVDVISLKSYLNRKVDFLKMDIEGAEFVVLKDIQEELKNVQQIFVEYHSFIGEEQSLPEMITILKDAGFRLYMSNPGNVSIASPLMGYGNYLDMDFQLNIFGKR